MNVKEASKFLSMVKIAYPSAYRDIDAANAEATENMWAASFPEVPFSIMAMAFNNFRFHSKFPPTVAEIVDELHGINCHALELYNLHRFLGNAEESKKYWDLYEATTQFQPLNVAFRGMTNTIGGALRAGTPGDRLDRTDRLSLLDAGTGGIR